MPTSTPTPPLRIFGARQNNLRGFDLEIPHDRLVVVTGVSGSGKSSLAFDTVFAEGQWRFLESLPSYTRMLMEKVSRPQVDGLEHVRPAVALQQHNDVRSARSTVGTATELYDLFRVLFAAAGELACPNCGDPVRTWTAAAAAAHADAALDAAVAEVQVPLERLEWLPRSGWVADLAARGFARVRAGDRLLRLDGDDLPPSPPEGAVLVLDRVRTGSERTDRLTRALEQAFQLGHGLARVQAGDTTLPFNTRHRCDRCDVPVPDLRPVLFSFNHPLGACPECNGFGAILEPDEGKIVPDPTRSLRDGAIEPWQTPSSHWWQEQLVALAGTCGIPLDIPWGDLSPEARGRVWHGHGQLEGITAFFRYLEDRRYKMHVRVFIARYRGQRRCPSCGGARLRPEVCRVQVGETSICDLAALDLRALGDWVRDYEPRAAPGTRELLWRIEHRVDILVRLGLHYLSMDRPTRTLSGGEAQRAALALQLQHHLTGTTYVLDEPTVGLHARDVDLLAGILTELAGRGNTVLAVEHDLGFIRRADHLVELGPGGGRDGGEVLFQGPPGELTGQATPTGRELARTGQPRSLPGNAPARGRLRLTGCHLHNLREVDVSFPLAALVCVTGVSGSGKSSLVTDTLVQALHSGGRRGAFRDARVEGAAFPKGVRAVDQSPMGRTPRSIPLTYVGAYTAVRECFASLPASRRLGLTAGDFSFNVKGGRCERCKGTGFEQLEMLFFEDLYVPCDTCGGRRFGPRVLSARYRGHSIHDVLTLTVSEGIELFADEAKIATPLRQLHRMGLGYLVLGQPANTLSGGEAQRLKIVAELLGRRPRDLVYVLDEPTTGLHGEDVGRLLDVLRDLVAAGNTVVAVEHHLEFIAAAEWLIDLGPEGGADGGSVVDSGTPEALATRALGHTGRYLRAWARGET